MRVARESWLIVSALVAALACSSATDVEPDPIDEPEPVVPDEPLALTPATVTMVFGTSVTLELTGGTPSTAAWRSSRPSVASVDDAGTVTGLAGGIATIWAVRGTDSVSSSVIVVIACAAGAVTPASAILLTGDSLKVFANASCSPSEAFAWTSSNPAVVTVEALSSSPGRSSAMMRAIGPGTALVVAAPGGTMAVTVR